MTTCIEFRLKFVLIAVFLVASSLGPTTASARQGATGPCSGGTGSSARYVDCGDGTVADTKTGLIWLKQADCLGLNAWDDANKAAAALKNGDCDGALKDGSSPGDWRLPTRDEWRASGMLDSRPSVFTGAQSDNYWSSTSDDSAQGRAFSAGLFTKILASDNKTFVLRTWPVRGGAKK
jgi:hypothetical protein